MWQRGKRMGRRLNVRFSKQLTGGDPGLLEPVDRQTGNILRTVRPLKVSVCWKCCWCCIARWCQTRCQVTADIGLSHYCLGTHPTTLLLQPSLCPGRLLVPCLQSRWRKSRLNTPSPPLFTLSCINWSGDNINDRSHNLSSKISTEMQYQQIEVIRKIWVVHGWLVLSLLKSEIKASEMLVAPQISEYFLKSLKF